MPIKKAPSFKTIPAGTAVSWHYRSAIGRGTVTGVHKRGTTAANTMYSITEHDHHLGIRGVASDYAVTLRQIVSRFSIAKRKRATLALVKGD